MAKINQTVRRETLYIAAWTLVLSLLMEAVFLIGGWWDYTVLLGNLLSAVVAVGNFLLLGLTVQKATGMDEEKRSKSFMQLSMMGRLALMFGAAALGALLPCFNIWATLIPLFFPRIAIFARPLFDRKPKD